MLKTLELAFDNLHHKSDNLTIDDKLEIIEICVGGGVDVNRNDYCIFFHFIDNHKIVKFMINNGLNLKDGDILKTACSWDKYEVVEMLLEAGVNYESALDKCYTLKMSMLKLLVSHGFDPLKDCSWLKNIWSDNKLELLEYLFDMGLQCKNIDKYTIRRAFQENTINVPKLLLDNGLDSNTIIDNRCILEIAILDNKFDFVEMLISYGADINLCIGKKFVFYCDSSETAEYMEIIEKMINLLLTYGLDIRDSIKMIDETYNDSDTD